MEKRKNGAAIFFPKTEEVLLNNMLFVRELQFFCRLPPPVEYLPSNFFFVVCQATLSHRFCLTLRKKGDKIYRRFPSKYLSSQKLCCNTWSFLATTKKLCTLFFLFQQPYNATHKYIQNTCCPDLPFK